MKLFFTLLLSASLNAEELFSKFENEWNLLQDYQKEAAQFIFNNAKKDNLQWTATAIAWQESQFGRWQVNVNSGGSWDCGVFQNNTKSVARHNNINYNQYNKKEICTELITSFEYSYINFTKEIKYWNEVHNDNWNKIWSSYNGGWKGNQKYSNMIKERIKVLEKYLKG